MVLKCAAVNCRSGFRPTKKEIGSISKSVKRHVFAFPRNEKLRALWIKVISRQDSGLNPDNAGVCELHFRPEDFVTGITPRTKTERKRKRLNCNVVPSNFPNYPKTARPKEVMARPTSLASSSARHSQDNEVIRDMNTSFLIADKLTDLQDLFSRLSNEQLPSGFRPVMMQLPGGDQLISIRTEYIDDNTGLPTIRNNVTVYSNLNFVLHANGLQLSTKKVFDITSKAGQFTTMNELVNVLARVKSLTADITDHLETAANILDALQAEEIEENVRLLITFAAEQIRLVSKPLNRRRYSSFLLSNAVVWDRLSPKMYDTLHRSNMLCLPHSRTLRRLTSALQVSNGLDSGTTTYLGLRIEQLQPRERLVNLAMDEVYTSQSVELAGGRVYGETEGIVTKTLFCTHINSVAGNYTDMVSMTPVPHVKKDDIVVTFNKVLQGLTEVGFTVVSVTTDNHRTNQSWHNSLGEDGRHPEFILNPYASDESRIYTMYDSVHIFKNVYYGLLKNKILHVPPFSNSEDSPRLKVDFGHLVRLYNMERGHPGKLAYKLTDKVLKPSALERVNVSLAAAATHESTSAALRHFAALQNDCRGFADTAQFLELVRRWFNICNVKSSNISNRLNDKNRVALRSACSDSERSQKFLLEFGEFMRSWQESDVLASHKITKDTSMAVFHTSRGLVGLSRYLLEKYSSILDYFLSGKIQSDGIESHFGHLRKLAGSNYWASVRQFMENEAVIRIKSLIWWSGLSVGEISRAMSPCRQDRELEDKQVVEVLVEVVSLTDDEDLESSTKAALGHIAGYLARSATRGNKCSACSDLLVHRSSTPLDVNLEENPGKQVETIYRSFTELLDRGKLLSPSSTAIDVTLNICHVWRSLMKDESSRRKLMMCSLPRKVFVEIVSRLTSDDVQFSPTMCNEGHSLVNKLVPQMAGALFNLFASNMIRDINSDIHAKRKPFLQGGQAKVTRSQTDDKRRKLTGCKKN